jgi:hypothetical protein
MIVVTNGNQCFEKLGVEMLVEMLVLKDLMTEVVTDTVVDIVIVVTVQIIMVEVDMVVPGEVISLTVMTILGWMILDLRTNLVVVVETVVAL